MQHSFDIEIAEKYGMLEAVLLNNINYWIEKNKANNDNFFDGKYWTFNSAKAFAELFPYASVKQIRTALKHLEIEGLIEVGNYNNSAYDRTLWYTITEKGNRMLHNCKPEVTNWETRGYSQVTPIPNINTNINTDINTIGGKKAKRANEELTELDKTLLDFYEMRKKLKKPMTSKAKDLLIKKLNDLTNDEKEQIEILNQSIVNSWQSVYPLKQEDNKFNNSKASNKEQFNPFEYLQSIANGEHKDD